MVGNEEQWDDIEYSDQNEDNSYYNNSDYADENSEYSEEDYDNGYEDEYDEEDSDYAQQGSGAFSKPKSSKLPLIIIFLLLLGVGGFFAISKLSKDNNVAIPSGADVNQAQDDLNLSMGSDDDVDFINDGTNSATGNDDMMNISFDESGNTEVGSANGKENAVATVKDASQENAAQSANLADDSSNNDIIVSYDKPQKNPFKPYIVKVESNSDDQAKIIAASLPKPDFEIIEPPAESISDPNLTKLLQTQISGILYDDVSPSAIVNLNGVDTFVKVGDSIYGYTIKSITRNYVQINYQNNTYVASVGELFTKGAIDKPAVANIEKKFAGRYK